MAAGGVRARRPPLRPVLPDIRPREQRAGHVFHSLHSAGGEKVPLEAAQLEGGGGQHDKRRGPEGEKIQQGPQEGEGQSLSIIHPSLCISIWL